MFDVSQTSPSPRAELICLVQSLTSPMMLGDSVPTMVNVPVMVGHGLCPRVRTMQWIHAVGLCQTPIIM